MSSLLKTMSKKFAPIPEGRQIVKFGPDLLRYLTETGEFPDFQDAFGPYIYLQFAFANGATTASLQDVKENARYEDTIKIRVDGKYEGDGYNFRRWSEELRKLNKSYRYMPADEILLDLVGKEFPVYIYRTSSGKRNYLQVAWSQAEYNKAVGRMPKKQAAKTETVEEDLPFEL